MGSAARQALLFGGGAALVAYAAIRFTEGESHTQQVLAAALVGVLVGVTAKLRS